MKKNNSTRLWILIGILVSMLLFIALSMYCLYTGPWNSKGEENKITEFCENDIQKITEIYKINTEDNVEIVYFSRYLRKDGATIYILELSGINNVNKFVDNSDGLSTNKAIIYNDKFRKGFGFNDFPNVFYSKNKVTIVTLYSEKYKNSENETCKRLYDYYFGIEKLFSDLYKE